MASLFEMTVTRSVDTEAIYARAAARCFNRIMLAAHRAAVETAPVDKGVLRSSLAPGAGYTMVDPSTPPRFARLGTNVTPYPRDLDESDTKHYASGPRKGELTKGWFSGVRERIEPDIADALSALGDEIKGGWRHG